jgi:trans-aconitate methyltransferase
MPTPEEIKKLVSDHALWEREFGNSPEAVGWSSERNSERLEALVEPWMPVLLSSRLRVVDLGCGLAHLKDYLDGAGVTCDYTGVDLSPEVLKRAQKKHPKSSFILGDATSVSVEGDIFVSAGMFNRFFEDSAEACSRTLAKVQRACRIGASFNFLSSQALSKTITNYYVNLAQIDSFVEREFTEGFRIDGQSLPGEIFLHLWRAGWSG